MSKKTVLITGSNKGIGRCLALEFSGKGYDIIIHGRDRISLEEVKQQIEKNSECSIVVGDITSEKTIEDLAELAKSKGIDILVNNAGIYLNNPVENMSFEECKNMMDVNFFAPVRLIKAILPIFKEKGSGLIVNINSIAGKQSTHGESAYCASKHALRGFSNSLKPEVINYARIIDIYLGATATQMTKGRRADFDLLIKPEEAAKAIVRNCDAYETLCPKEIDIGRINYEEKSKINVNEKESDLNQKAKGKEYSPFKILHSEHQGKLDALLQGRVTPPVHVRLKPTNKCDHNCTTCAYHYGLSSFHPLFSMADEIPEEKIHEILSDFKNMGVKAVTFSGGGEPLTYQHIISALKQTIDYGIDFAMNTNGQLLNGERAELLSKASWVRVSANAIDARTFESLRRVPQRLFYELISNIRNFAQMKPKSCTLGINFVVHKENAPKIYESVKFFKELGADNIKFTPVWGPDFFEYHKDIITPVTEQISRARQDFQDDSFRIYDTYKQDFGLTGFSERTYDKCYTMQICPAIGADCGVYACFSKAYDSTGLMGSIKNQSFKSLWFSEKTADFLKSFNPKNLCKHQCPVDEKNLALIDFIKNKGSINIPKDPVESVNFV